MKVFEYTITDPQGVHARPAGQLVKEASNFNSDIQIEKDGQKADAKRIFAIMGLGIKSSQTIKVTFNGSDEDIAYNKISEFLKENL